MHKLLGSFYNLRNRKVKTTDYDDLTSACFCSAKSVTATFSFPNSDEYTKFSSSTYVTSRSSTRPPPTSSPYICLSLAPISSARIFQCESNLQALVDAYRLCYLLDAYHTSNSQSQTVLCKSFLYKLPVHARSILVGSFDTNLDPIALRSDEIIAVCKYSSDINGSQRLINKIFGRRLNKLSATMDNSFSASPQQPRQLWYDAAVGLFR